MTVYAENVFITNVFMDFFIFYLTLSLLRCPICWRRMSISSILGGMVSALLPLAFAYETYVKVVCVILFPFLIKKNHSFREYRMTLTVFVVITFLLGGVFVLLKCIYRYKIFLNLSYGIIPILFSVSGCTVLLILGEIRKNYPTKVKRNTYIRMVKIFDEKNSYSGEAFFDSGNQVFANNGEPVIFVGKRIYTFFAGKEDAVTVRTVAGESTVWTKPAQIEIYCEEKDNMIYTTRIACASYLGDKEIILHNALGG